MKNCDHFVKSFSEYLDETLDEADKSSLQSHLEKCVDCRDKLDDLVRVKKSLASLPRKKTSPSFDVVLHARIRQERRAKQSSSRPFLEWGWKVPAYAVVAVFLMFIGAYVQRLALTPDLASQNNMIAVENALRGEMNYIDPGYMVFAGMDSVRNTFKVVNYTDIDKALTMEDFEGNRTNAGALYIKNIQSEGLPNLKDAPKNTTFSRQRTNQLNPQNIRQAEFIF